MITEFARDALLDSDRRRQMPIPAQIREAVEKFPGIANLDLPRMIEMAIPKGTIPDLRRHAEAPRCKVDVDGQWWPARPLSELEPGKQTPLANFAEDVVRSEWVTITNAGPDPDHQDAIACRDRGRECPVLGGIEPDDSQVSRRRMQRNESKRRRMAVSTRAIERSAVFIAEDDDHVAWRRERLGIVRRVRQIDCSSRYSTRKYNSLKILARFPRLISPTTSTKN